MLLSHSKPSSLPCDANTIRNFAEQGVRDSITWTPRLPDPLRKPASFIWRPCDSQRGSIWSAVVMQNNANHSGNIQTNERRKSGRASARETHSSPCKKAHRLQLLFAQSPCQSHLAARRAVCRLAHLYCKCVLCNVDNEFANVHVESAKLIITELINNYCGAVKRDADERAGVWRETDWGLVL